MKRYLPLFLVLCVAPFVLDVRAEEGNRLQGIRGNKCAKTRDEAREALFQQMMKTSKICPEGKFPNQVGGWTCSIGVGCPKKQFRCNSQFQCGPTPQTGIESDPPVDAFLPPPPPGAPAPSASGNPVESYPGEFSSPDSYGTPSGSPTTAPSKNVMPVTMPNPSVGAPVAPPPSGMSTSVTAPNPSAVIPVNPTVPAAAPPVTRPGLDTD